MPEAMSFLSVWCSSRRSPASVPDSVEIQADALSVTVLGHDGRIWKSGPYDYPALPRNASRSDVPTFNGLVVIAPAFFSEERERKVTLRASLYLTLFGDSRLKTVPLQTTPINVMDGLQCRLTGVFNRFSCQSALRWPARLVYARFGESDIQSLRSRFPTPQLPPG